jgi:hypothetical protein
MTPSSNQTSPLWSDSQACGYSPVDGVEQAEDRYREVLRDTEIGRGG